MASAPESLVHRYVEEVCDRRQLDLIDEFFQPGVIIHGPAAPGGLVQGVAQFKWGGVVHHG